MGLYDIKSIERLLLSQDRIVWFSDIPEGKRAISDKVKRRITDCAESWEGYIHAEYGDSYGEYERNMNRCNFEDLYINRRACLADMALFEMFIGGRYIPQIEEMIRRICDEEVWCVPSHYKTKTRETTNHVIELYAAETASVLAFTCHFLGDRLSSDTVSTARRAINERMFIPYTETDLYGWMGVDGHKINNWNPWINSNIMFCAALICQSDEEYRTLVLRALKLTENYINSLGDDCLCDEGIRYWSLSGACLFDISEILYDLTGGAIDLTKQAQVYGACDYLTGMYDEYGNPANSGDATIDFYPQCATLVRAGERTGNDLLANMGRALYKPECLRVYHDNFYRQIKDIYTASSITAPTTLKYPEAKLLNSINIFTVRKDGFFLCFKGNHNGEYHNHNDVGNFVIYHSGTPIFIDAGVDLYSGYTFSKDFRYKLWYMRSDFHSVPVISGKIQQMGAQFAATPLKVDGFCAECDISRAYGEGLAPWIRSAELDGEVIKITDRFENTEGTLLHYMLRDEPKIDRNKLIFDCGICAELDGIRELSLERIDITGKNPPDGIPADAPNRKESRSYLIPRLMEKQWNKSEIFRLTAVPDKGLVSLKVYKMKADV